MTKKVFINDRFYKVFLQKNLVLQKLRNATGILRFFVFCKPADFCQNSTGFIRGFGSLFASMTKKATGNDRFYKVFL
jgi:hypothetical protein